MLANEVIFEHCLMKIESIEDNWKKYEWIDSEFLIDKLLSNDKSFFDFGSLCSADKHKIDNIIKKQRNLQYKLI